MDDKSIVIVEDTMDLRASLTELLELEGYMVNGFATGEAALVRLESIRPDVIITDLLLPGMDGVRFIRQVRKMHHFLDTPIIVFSAKPAVEYEKETKLAGADFYLKKPSSLDEVLNAVKLFC